MSGSATPAAFSLDLTPGATMRGGEHDVLRALADATVLGAADVHTALTLGRLAGGADDEVLVAAALAVRAVRLGHVFVDLATVAATAVPDDDLVDLGDGIDPGALPWPDARSWPAVVAASPLTATGVDGPDDRPLRLVGTRLYLDRYWRHERAIVADLLRRSAAAGPAVDVALLAAGLRRLFPPTAGETGDGAAGDAVNGPSGEGAAADHDGELTDFEDDDRQRLAAATAVLRRFTVVAGGPGTGKTTTVARILALLHEQAAAAGGPPPRVGLAAPTGKAAARLAEAVHAEAGRLPVDDAVRAALVATPASTLHRLLGWQPGNRSRFRHDAANQLPHNVVIVDESSMVSLSMMAKLLVAVRDSARLVLVGDPRQLASVEAGAVLGDIVGPAAGALQLRPTARGALAAAVGAPVEADDPGPDVGIGDGIIVLRRVHRFGGGIAAVADAVEAGDPDAVVAALRRSPGDVRWLEADAPVDPSGSPLLADVRRAVVDAAVAVVTAARRGDAAAALEALRSVQVLCAHRRGPSGAGTWRAEIERWLRAAVPGFGAGAGGFGAGPWYAGRPLLVTENDYGLGVFNGDTGVVIDSDPGGTGRLRAVFDRRGEVLSVRPARLASVESLYAMTIHKAQGSQFAAVVVVLPDAASPLLTRELLYTAVTRAERHLTVVGPEDSVRAAVTRPIARASGLAEALWEP